jgi:hypothetical protein
LAFDRHHSKVVEPAPAAASGSSLHNFCFFSPAERSHSATFVDGSRKKDDLIPTETGRKQNRPVNAAPDGAAAKIESNWDFSQWTLRTTSYIAGE